MHNENFHVTFELESLECQYKVFSDSLDNKKRQKFEIERKIQKKSSNEPIDRRELMIKQHINTAKEKLAKLKNEVSEIKQNSGPVLKELKEQLHEHSKKIVSYELTREQLNKTKIEREIVEELQALFPTKVVSLKNTK